MVNDVKENKKSIVHLIVEFNIEFVTSILTIKIYNYKMRSFLIGKLIGFCVSYLLFFIF